MLALFCWIKYIWKHPFDRYFHSDYPCKLIAIEVVDIVFVVIASGMAFIINSCRVTFKL